MVIPLDGQSKPPLYLPASLEKKILSIPKYALTVAQAPAGFGKTAALHTLLDQLSPVFYLPCRDGSMGHYWTCFCRAVQSFDTNCAEKLRFLSPQFSDDLPLISEALQDAVCPQPVFFVMESFQKLPLSDKPRFLRMLEESACRNLHFIVMITTEEGHPPLKLPVGRRVLRLQADDFTFSVSDAVQFFHETEPTASLTDCSLAWSYTGGQATGLWLQRYYYHKTGTLAPYGPDRLIDDSIWKNLSLSEKEFFLALSLTPVFTLELACFLTGFPVQAASALLESCPLIYTDSDTFLKMHDWFLHFLQPRFSLLPEQNRCRLLRRAGEWYVKQNELETALQFFYRAGERERIFSLLNQGISLPVFAETCDTAMVLSLLRDTARDIRLRYINVLLLLSFSLLLQGQLRELESCIPELRETIYDSPLSPHEKNKIYSGLEFLLIFLHFDHLEEVDLHFHRALSYFPSTQQLKFLPGTYFFCCPSMLCLFHRKPGDFSSIIRQFDENLPLYVRMTDGHGKGCDLLLRAEISFMAGDMLTAEILSGQAEEEARSHQQYDIVTSSLWLLCRIALFLGNRKNFDQAFSALQIQCQKAKSRQELAICDLARGFLAAVTSKPEKAPLWLFHGTDAGSRLDYASLAFSRIITGRLLLLQQDHTALLEFCNQGLLQKDGPVFLLSTLYLTIYKACALEATGYRGQALTCLQQALRYAMPDNLYMPFAENWDRLQPLMAQIPATTLPHEIRKEIESLGNDLYNSLRTLFANKPPLTLREQEVLDLLCSGMNDRQIAKELDLTTPGMKRIMTSLLEKTGALSRAHLRQLYTLKKA